MKIPLYLMARVHVEYHMFQQLIEIIKHQLLFALHLQKQPIHD